MGLRMTVPHERLARPGFSAARAQVHYILINPEFSCESVLRINYIRGGDAPGQLFVTAFYDDYVCEHKLTIGFVDSRRLDDKTEEGPWLRLTVGSGAAAVRVDGAIIGACVPRQRIGLTVFSCPPDRSSFVLIATDIS
jgi:hypothetical protein